MSDFHTNEEMRDGYINTCKECGNVRNKGNYYKNIEDRKEWSKNYYKTNKKEIINRNKEYRKDNIENKKEYDKEYYQINKDNINKNIRQRRKTDVNFRRKEIIKSTLRSAFRVDGYKKNGTTEKMLGCSYEHLLLHLEKQFTEGMNWSNKGMFGWHIDHKIPLSSSDTEEGRYKLNHYTNLQPLWAKDNLSKGCKLDWVKE